VPKAINHKADQEEKQVVSQSEYFEEEIEPSNP